MSHSLLVHITRIGSAGGLLYSLRSLHLLLSFPRVFNKSSTAHQATNPCRPRTIFFPSFFFPSRRPCSEDSFTSLGKLPSMVEETESKRETSVLLRTIEELHSGEDGLENLGKLVGSVINAPRVNFSCLFLSCILDISTGDTICYYLGNIRPVVNERE